MAEQYPFLIPAYLLLKLGGYGSQVITGKRKPIRVSTVMEAKKRVELYKQFKLFES